MTHLLKSFGCFLLVLLVVAQLQAQEGNTWIFGNNAGLDFNGPAPVPILGSNMQTIEGCASIANSTGSLLFYTNGIEVWDQSHTVMANGTGLLGDESATQSAIIIPHPGVPLFYFIVTIDAVENSLANGLNYSEVDLSLNGGLGDVVAATKNTLIAPFVVEKITAVRHTNGTDFWLIAHEADSDNFLVYLIDAAGINLTPVISAVGEVHGSTMNDPIGYLKGSTQGDRIALAITGDLMGNDPVQNVEVFDFDNSTGIVSNPISWDPGFGGPYGVEFSPDGSRLYISCVRFDTAAVYQYNLQAGSPAAIAASEFMVAPLKFTGQPDYGALQLAPDGKIYIARQGIGSLDVINQPNLLGAASNYAASAVSLGGLGPVSQVGLPTFITSFFSNTASFSFTQACLGDTAFFFPDTNGLTSVQWNFGDPASGANNTSTSFFPFHIFSALGTYTVKLVVSNGTSSDSIVQNVSVVEVPQVTLPNDTALCQGAVLALDVGQPTVNYLWQDSSTAPTFTIDSAGQYYVTVENDCGLDSDTILVQYDDSIQFSLGPDTATCGGIAFNFAPSIPASANANWLWQDNSTDTIFIASETDTIILQLSNACGTVSDKVEVTFNVFPTVNLPNDTFYCVDVPIVLNTAGEDGVTYLWSDSSSGGSFNADTSGSYWLQATNPCATVADTFTVQFFDPISFELGNDTTICNEDSLELIATSAGATGYAWSTNSIDTSIYVTETGTYQVTVSLGLCTITDQITIVAERASCFEGIDCAIIAPNVFTPNNDGINDEFLVSSSCSFTGYQLTVYSRWGQKVFTSDRPLLGWDGTVGGLPLPNGVYYWLLDYQHEVVVDVDRNEQAGSVSLMR